MIAEDKDFEDRVVPWRGYQVLSDLAVSSRALARFRLGLSLLVILDCCQRSMQLSLYYTDLGLLARYRAQLLMLNTSKVSLYFLSGRPSIVIALMVVTVLLAVQVLRGKSSRPSRFCLWFLVASLQARNPLVCDSADDLLRLMLFWDIFLPEGGRATEERRILSWPIIAIQLQVSVALVASAVSLCRTSHLSFSSWAPGLMGFSLPWFGVAEAAVLGAGGLCLWVRRLRRPWLFLLFCSLAVRALALDPAFPLVMAVACLSFWESGESAGLSVEGALRRVLARLGLAPRSWSTPVGAMVWPRALAIFVVALMGVGALGGIALAPWKSGSEMLGLGQDWSKIYPGSVSPGASLEYRQAGVTAPLFTLGAANGRRSGLFADRLMAAPSRVAESTLDSKAIPAVDGGWLELWQVRYGQPDGLRLSPVQARMVSHVYRDTVTEAAR